MDVVKGNLTLFMRRDELDAAWRWIDPIREGWAQDNERTSLHRRQLGSGGLQRADQPRRVQLGRRGMNLRQIRIARGGRCGTGSADRGNPAPRAGRAAACQPGRTRRPHPGSTVPRTARRSAGLGTRARNADRRALGSGGSSRPAMPRWSGASCWRMPPPLRSSSRCTTAAPRLPKVRHRAGAPSPASGCRSMPSCWAWVRTAHFASLFPGSPGIVAGA